MRWNLGCLCTILYVVSRVWIGFVALGFDAHVE